MTQVRVWAPKPKTVELLLDGRPLPMDRSRNSWWCAEVEKDSFDYMFVLDGGTPVPDPRSPWQPEGVHGPSRTLDHSCFAWSDREWQAPPLSSACIYELHVGTFTREGTFESAIERLEYLRWMGITHIELMPVQEFSGAWGWGYDGVDLFAPHHAYGGPEELKRFVDACHGRGLAVLLDVVYNHLGPVGNYLDRFGPYFTDKYSTPWGPALNLDGPESDEVRGFLCDNARMWLRDYHMDGLRLDAIHAIHDSSATHFLEQLRGEVKALEARTGRSKVLIAESDLNDPRLVKAPEAGGFGLDAQWSDDFHHGLHAALTRERGGYYGDFGSLGDVAAAMKNAFVYAGRYSCFRKRIHGRPASGISGHRFLGYLQTHDQVGNRAKGERSSALMSLGRLKIGAALVMCAPFIPMIFQGEEFASSAPFLYFTNHRESGVGAAVSEGRKKEFAAFGWKPEEIPDPQDRSSFERSKLDWSELNSFPHTEMLDWYRRLIALRRTHAELADGRLDHVDVRFDDQEQWLEIQRGAIRIFCNLSDRARPVHIEGEVLLASRPECSRYVNAIEIEPDGIVIARENIAHQHGPACNGFRN